ncbi:MAG: hypothetical protein QNJ40_17600 [Xanthomonadales bacterium]|nr:hypothetical protein [Xanthomonadales bacterium]
MTNRDSSVPLSFDPAGEFVVVRVVGDAGKADYFGYARSVRDYCERHRCRRVLLDESNLSWPLDIFLAYDLAEWMVSSQFGMLIQRIACVTGGARFDMIANMEVLAQNRGINYRAFSDLQAAEEWLLSGIPGHPDPRFPPP